MVSITIKIPEEALTVFGETPEARSRFAIEAIVSDAYRQSRFDTVDGQSLLGASEEKFQKFLKARDLPISEDERRDGQISPSFPTRPLQPDWPVRPIIIDVPDALAVKLGKTPEEMARFALDAVVIEAYRRALFTRHELAALLDIGVMEFDDFQSEHNIPNNCTVEMFVDGYAAAKRFLVPPR